jgi:hypothetical protein
MTKYVIDTCSFIELAHNYRKNVFPDAWNNLENLLANKTIVSSHFVFEEIKNNAGSDLTLFIDKYIDIFIEPTEEIQSEAKKILHKYPNLLRVLKRKSGADPFIIATAIILNVPIITEEKKSGDIKYPHIPDVCSEIDHKCLRLIDLFEKEGYIFTNFN